MNGTVKALDGLLELNIELYDQGTVYRLEDSEHLIVRCRDQSVELSYRTLQYAAHYAGALEIGAPLEGDEPITITLDRGTNDAATFVAAAPPPLLLQPPAMLRDVDPVPVTWTPVSSDPMRWYDELLNEGPIPHDDGTLTFPPGVLAPMALTSTAYVHLTIVRERVSSGSEPLHGRMVVTRTSSTDFEIAP